MEQPISRSSHPEISLRKAALIAGVGVLIMALTVPWVEFYIFPKLIDHENAAQTVQNISSNPRLFSLAIFIHFLTVICDLVVTWALYIFLTPANKDLALLSAWFRIAYTAFNVTALLNLVKGLVLIRGAEAGNTIEPDQLGGQVSFLLNSFNLQWRLGLTFFGVYLCLLGYLVFRAKYIPGVIGILLIVAGLGYMVDDLKFFFYPDVDTGFLWFTYFGELIFMFWLLIKGSRIRDEEWR
jgi:hypothetical protein